MWFSKYTIVRCEVKSIIEMLLCPWYILAELVNYIK